MVAYQDNGIDKRDRVRPAEGLSQRMRERREGVKQNSAAHRVSIGSKTDQSGGRRTCPVGSRSLLRDARFAGGAAVESWITRGRRCGANQGIKRTLHRLTGGHMSNVTSRVAEKRMDDYEGVRFVVA